MTHETELFEAMKARDAARVKALLRDHPTLLSARAPDGTTALLLATFMRASQLVDAFLAAGAKPDLWEAAALGDAPRLRELLHRDRALANAVSPEGWTALHLAAHYGHRDAIQLLLTLGANPRITSRHRFGPGNTPLHAAVAGGQTGVLGMLVQAGADVNAQDDAGHTPLHIAAANANADAVRWLLAHGARPDARNRDAKTPLDIARERESDEVVPLLAGASGLTR